MAESRTILVVIDPTAQDQPAFERAAWLAKRIGAGVELFICYYDQYLSGERFFDSSGLERARQNLIADQRRRLEGLAETLSADGVVVSVDARWDHPLDEGIVRKANEVEPLFVVKDTHHHTALKRTIFSNTDWNLIRACPVPLLLVKPRDLAEAPVVITAVDPMHDHDKPAELDNRIMETAQDFTRAVEGQLHVFHSFDPAPAIAGAADTMATPISVPVAELTEALAERHRAAVDDLLEEYPVERQRLHIHQGVPQELLVTLAEQLEADFVVMGALSRSGLKRVFLGSTAEQVLDRLPCDLIIIKPADFNP